MYRSGVQRRWTRWQVNVLLAKMLMSLADLTGSWKGVGVCGSATSIYVLASVPQRDISLNIYFSYHQIVIQFA